MKITKVQYASLLSLGYICEELRTDELKKEQSNYVISALLESLEKNHHDPDLITQTIKGIYHSLKFTKRYFEENQGNVIMGPIIDATKYSNVDVREIAMQCIVEIVRLSYDHIEPFMGDITEVTTRATEEDESQVQTQAIDVWSSIAEEEKIRIDNKEQHFSIIERALDILVKMITECIKDLNIGNEDVDEDQEWGTSVAAGCCLSLISRVVEDKIVEPITNFVAANIDSEMWWKNKYVGLVALGAILEGPSKEYLQEILTPAVPKLLDLIDDSTPRVRLVSCWLFSKIAKLNHELISDKDSFPVLYIKLLRGLEEGGIISINICSIISEWAESILNQDTIVHTCILSQVYQELLNKLIDYVLSDQDQKETLLKRRRVSGFSAIYNLLQYAPEDCEYNSIEFMGYVLELLEKSVNVEGAIDTTAEEFQGFFFCAVQCILTNIRKDLDPNYGWRVIELVINIFQQRGDVFEEAFLALSAVANKFPEAINSQVNKIGPFLIHGLRSENAAIIRNVCGLISDLCTLVESPVIIYEFKSYMPILLKHLSNSRTEVSVQIIIISLIGDTFLLTKDKFKPFLDESLSILEEAAKMWVEVPKNYQSKPEDIFNQTQFQSALIEAYTCFVQNIKEAGDTYYQTLGGFIGNIFAFLMGILDKAFNPTIVSHYSLSNIGYIKGDLWISGRYSSYLWTSLPSLIHKWWEVIHFGKFSPGK